MNSYILFNIEHSNKLTKFVQVLCITIIHDRVYSINNERHAIPLTPVHITDLKCCRYLCIVVIVLVKNQASFFFRLTLSTVVVYER